MYGHMLLTPATGIDVYACRGPDIHATQRNWESCAWAICLHCEISSPIYATYVYIRVTGQNGSGQNGTDKMVHGQNIGQNGTDKMVLDKMVRTK